MSQASQHDTGVQVISRTHFEKKFGTKSDKWQWFWRTENPNGESIGVGAKGYGRLVGALNGFFSQQRAPDWEPDQPHIPDGYAMEKIDDTHHIIYKYVEPQ